MLRTLLSASVLCAAITVAAPAHASDVAPGDGTFGIGVIVGDPTGLSAKIGFGGAPAAIDFGLGFGMFDGRGLAAHADFLWHLNLHSFDRAGLDLYFGVGPKIALFPDADLFFLGARAPVGVDFLFDRVPIDVFIEVAAGLWIIEVTDFDIDAAVGFRWWF